jgi:hypothetical protein
MYLAQDHLQGQAFEFVVSNLQVMLPDSNTDLRQIGCEDTRWMITIRTLAGYISSVQSLFLTLVCSCVQYSV